MRGHRVAGLVPAILAAAAAGPGAAQMLHPGHGALGAPMSNFITSSYLSRELVDKTPVSRQLARSDARSDARAVPTQPSAILGYTPRSSATTAARTLADAYPPEVRAQARETFERLLAGWRGIEQRFGLPPNDLAGAVAALVAGSWMGYHNADFPDAHFRPLVDQLRGILATRPDIRAASDAQKQELYETYVILGMFMATTQMGLKERPDPRIEAGMRQAAQGYLEAFFKADARRVHIGSQGVTLQ